MLVVSWFISDNLECQLYNHDRFDPSEENKTVSLDSPWVHYSKLTETDILINSWAKSLPNSTWETTKNQLAQLNTTRSYNQFNIAVVDSHEDLQGPC